MRYPYPDNFVVGPYWDKRLIDLKILNESKFSNGKLIKRYKISIKSIFFNYVKKVY